MTFVQLADKTGEDINRLRFAFKTLFSPKIGAINRMTGPRILTKTEIKKMLEFIENYKTKKNDRKKRQIDVIKMYNNGIMKKEIALKTNLSIDTVRNYISTAARIGLVYRIKETVLEGEELIKDFAERYNKKQGYIGNITKLCQDKTQKYIVKDGRSYRVLTKPQKDFLLNYLLTAREYNKQRASKIDQKLNEEAALTPQQFERKYRNTTTPDPKFEYILIGEAAKITGIDANTLYLTARDGRLEYAKNERGNLLLEKSGVLALVVA